MQIHDPVNNVPENQNQNNFCLSEIHQKQKNPTVIEREREMIPGDVFDGASIFDPVSDDGIRNLLVKLLENLSERSADS